MGAAAAYMMDIMRIRLNSAQLKAETGAELGNNKSVEIEAYLKPSWVLASTNIFGPLMVKT